MIRVDFNSLKVFEKRHNCRHNNKRPRVTFGKMSKIDRDITDYRFYFNCSCQDFIASHKYVSMVYEEYDNGVGKLYCKFVDVPDEGTYKLYKLKTGYSIVATVFGRALLYYSVELGVYDKITFDAENDTIVVTVKGA